MSASKTRSKSGRIATIVKKGDGDRPLPSFTPTYVDSAKRAYVAMRKASADRVYDHSLGWYGIVSRDRFRELYTGEEEIYSFLALAQLRLL